MDDGDGLNQGTKFREGMKGNFYNFVVTGFPKRGVQVEHDVTISNLEANTLSFNNSIVDNINPFVYTSSFGNDTSSFIINTFDDASYNNNFASDGSLTGFLNGFIGVQAAGAIDPTTLGSWFTSGNFIGAVDAANNWTSGWTRAL